MADAFSTDLVPAADRFEAWLEHAKQICGDCRFHFPKRLPFHGSIERRTLAGSGFTSFSSSAVSFAKFPSVTVTAEDQDLIVITQLRGNRCYRQNGRVALLSPGDTTLIDAGQPWTSECADSCARLYLRVPRWMLQEQLRSSSLPAMPRILGKRGLGATLFSLASSLYEEADTMTLEEGAVALRAYLEVLAGCLGRPEASSTKLDCCAQLRPRVESFIETHLRERSLSPAVIAAAAGISVRHLHRLFASKGCTVSGWIRERRLEHCRGELTDACLSGWSITDIALRWGFSDSAHFSHCFHKEFGVSPRQFRSHALRRAGTQVSRALPHGFSIVARAEDVLHN